MLSLTHLPLEKLAAAYPVCCVEPVVGGRADLDDLRVGGGEPMVLVMPASPEDAVTVTPAATAASLNAWSALRVLMSG